jgi:glycosyltransferase involved in cell wall biosynthesis
VLEAAMHGKPVVASGSVGGADILLPDETGILLPEGSPDELIDALRRLIADPELRQELGDAAMDHAARNFDPVPNARRVEAVYDALLGRAPAQPIEVDEPAEAGVA